MTAIKLGKYRHFKGSTYDIIGVAIHSETQEELVVYKSAEGVLWVRPKKMFIETVTRDGKTMPRFELIG